MSESARIDKWLWEVRIFKTRNQATVACKAGRIRIAGSIVKPSRELRAGDEIQVSQPPLVKTFRVLGFPPNRVAAKLVPEFMEDLTPAGELEKLKLMRETNFERRDPGAGRPTKRERREIEYLKKIWKD